MSDDKEITSEEALEDSEKKLERKLTKEELRLKARIEKFFDANEGRDVVDIIGELVIRMEDLEKDFKCICKVNEDSWKRQGQEL